MTGRVLFPPEIVDLEGASIFLAGPIKGTITRWQDNAIEYLQEHAPELHVFSPRRSKDRAKDYTQVMYNEQIAWEIKHLKRSSIAGKGVVVFWFAKEETHYCERPFARTTRIEFGRIFAYCELLGAKMVVGIEAGFDQAPDDERDGADYIRQTIADELPDVPICDTLEETLDAAIKIARSL